MTHFKLIVAGYNCEQYVERCINSIKAQTYTDYSVCLVNDASTDGTNAKIMECLGESWPQGWHFLHRTENAGALRSQHEGITIMDPKDGDVIVWVDMDDALASPESLAILDSYYDEHTPMTYGTYQPVPASDTCPPPVRYPVECEEANDYRNMMKWGIRYNHLRTVRWELYKRLDVKQDFFFNGDWMHLASDCAVMIPCLEMSGGRYKVIPEILYNYSSDNPISEWRKAPTGTDDMHAHLMRSPKKEPVWI
jgi:glycosyltransferase involved in cell wall biosynthesis